MTLPSIDDAWDFGDPAGSEARFRARIVEAGEAADASWRVEAHSQLARAVCLQRRYGDAHAILDGVARLVPPGGRARLRWRLERGRILNDQGRTAHATEAFAEALGLAEEAGEILLAADAHHMLAYVARGEDAVTRHREALAFCDRNAVGHDRLRRWRVTLHLNLGDALERLGRYAEARESVGAACTLAAELGLPARVAGGRVFLARLHRLEGDVPRAWSIVEEVFDPAAADGWAWEERAECLHALGRIAEARTAFREAHARLAADPWFPPEEAPRLERLRRMATPPSPVRPAPRAE